MSDVLFGKVISVETRNLGEPVLADAAIGATTLFVQDAATFDEVGGVVSINGSQLAYSAIDADLDTLTLVAPLAVAILMQDLVEVYPASPVKTALIDMGDNSDPVPATVPYQLTDRLQDGTRDPGKQETVHLTRRGTYEYLVADVTAEDLLTQSLDFVDAEQGIGMTTAGAQFEDVNILGQASALDLKADSMSLGGTDLATMIAALPQGKILEQRKQTGTSAGSISTTEVALFVINCGDLDGGRQYRLQTQFLFQLSGTNSGLENYLFSFRYTTDGTEPTVASPKIPATKADHYLSVLTTNTDAILSMTFDIASDSNVQFVLTGKRTVGTTTGSIYQGNPSPAPMVVSLYDEGAIGSLTTTAVKQRLGLAEGLPVSTFTKTFNATWANGLDDYGNSQANTWVHIGIDETFAEGSYGLVGFDSTAITAALAGVVTPTQCTLRWRPRARKTGGLDVLILTHNYASYAASTAGYGGYDYPSDTGPVTSSGFTRVNAAPGTTYDNGLGTTIFNQFKAGTKKGIGFAGISGSATGSSGSVYGDGTYQCQLIFTYQGTS